MNGDQTPQESWKPIPLPLKLLSVVMVLWAVGSAMHLPNLFESGLPLLGTFVYGRTAFLVALFFDFIEPGVFLYTLWNRRPWATNWAFFNIGLFILNGTVALFIVSDQLGLTQILGPNLVSMVMLAVIFWKQTYFVEAD
ncbi:hypothetical protein [uncultured Sulfitobacter sp.]|uniref:hypothetical protein n=1 Tax=uncultured Sulfitobacter sp. TaxID=191468 RepID=UPI00262938EC|nr:hypothetical protein [uncultured Sulfitobacter sp.]